MLFCKLFLNENENANLPVWVFLSCYINALNNLGYAMNSSVLHPPLGLGPTVPELGDISHAKKFEKTCFSMVLPEVEEELKANGRKSVILCGIETQACILVCD